MSVVSNPVVVMKRYELKYIMSPEQTAYFKKSVEGYMKIDKFGLTSIASLYYDTPNYRLIRTSVEKPPFKEKIRLRSYGIATEESPVFLELKRKAYGIVYKRRVQSTIPLVNKFFYGEGDICAGGQINKEITTFRDYYRTLVPACLIVYDRIPPSDYRPQSALPIRGSESDDLNGRQLIAERGLYHFRSKGTAGSSAVAFKDLNRRTHL